MFHDELLNYSLEETHRDNMHTTSQENFSYLAWMAMYSSSMGA